MIRPMVRRRGYRIRAWNMKVGRGRTRKGARQIRRALNALARGRTEVIVLMETGGNRAAIDLWLERRNRSPIRAHGYRKYTGRGEIEASTIILVRRDVEVLDHGIIRTKVNWVGPQGKTIDGRAVPWVTINTPRGDLTVRGIHAVWNPTKNAAAQRDLGEQLREHAATVDGDLIDPGDQNQAPSVESPFSARENARAIGARPVLTGSGTDWAYASGRSWKGRLGAKRGSDHYDAIYDEQIGTAA